MGNEELNNSEYCFISKSQVDDKLYAFSTILIICNSNNSSLNNLFYKIKVNKIAMI